MAGRGSVRGWHRAFVLLTTTCAVALLGPEAVLAVERKHDGEALRARGLDSDLLARLSFTEVHKVLAMSVEEGRRYSQATHRAKEEDAQILSDTAGNNTEPVRIKGRIRGHLDRDKVITLKQLVKTHWAKPPRWLAKHPMKLQEVAVSSKTTCTVLAGPRGPAIIGGIGDSGTRGVAQLLGTGFGFEMCAGGSAEGVQGKCNKAGDNTVMFKLLGNKVLEHTNGHINYAVHNLSRVFHTSVYYHMCMGVNLTLQAMYDDAAVNRSQITQESKWGWKSPRSIYYLPYYKAIFKDNFRFVHVVRDGRDVAMGDNQMQYRSLCKHVPGIGGASDTCGGADRRSVANYADRVNFWARMNHEAYEYGRMVLGPKRYFLLRVEDMALAMDPSPLFKRLAAFLDLPEITEANMVVLKALCSGHASSYGGNKYNGTTRAQVIQQVGVIGRQVLDLFGYKIGDWGLAKDAPPVDTRPRPIVND